MYRNALRVALPAVVGLIPFAASGQAVTPERLLAGSLWSAACAEDGTCQMRAALTAEGTLVSRVLIYPVGAETVVEYLIPLGVDFLEGVRLVVDGNVQAETVLLTCRAAGCIGYAPLGEPLLAAMQDGTTLSVAFEGFEDAAAYQVDFELRGFSEAYTAYAKGQSTISATR